MSYDIGLFDRGFLKRAIESNLGDRTQADAIADGVKDRIIARAVAEGFRPVTVDAKFAEFLRAQGVEPAQEFELDTPTLLAQFAVYKGQVAFVIPYSARANASVDLCARIARELATELGLGYHDPQAGEVDY